MHDNPELKKFINKFLGIQIADNLFKSLQDGNILAMLMNKFKPGIIPIPDPSTFYFKRLENVAQFVKAAILLGVPSDEVFEAVELVELRNLKSVETCLYSLLRNAKINGYYNGEIVGPELRTKMKILDATTLKKTYDLPREISGIYKEKDTITNNKANEASKEGKSDHREKDEDKENSI